MSRAFEQPLYHGTIEAIPRIDVSRGRLHKDFGRGFYMSLSPDQAIGMMHKKHREAIRRSRNAERREFVEHLYRIQLKSASESELRVKVFDVANMEWLEFILMCRESELPHPHEFDVVIGPTADDDTLVSLQNYWKGVYGPVGSLAATHHRHLWIYVGGIGDSGCHEINLLLIKQEERIFWHHHHRLLLEVFQQLL